MRPTSTPLRERCETQLQSLGDRATPRGGFQAGTLPTCDCVVRGGLVGDYPVLFEERRRVVTVTGVRYRRMLEDFFQPQLEHRQVALSSMWFQQDGARPHTAAATLTRLQGAFPGKVLSKEGSVNWPPRSPDLSAPDYFLWGYLKAQVYRTPVRSLPILKRRIRAKLRSIPQRTLKAALDTVPLRARACIRRRGGHIETTVFH